MARQPLMPSSGVELLQPRAQPVDTFVAPPRTNAMLDFANALGTFDPAMREFLEERGQEQKERDTKQADALFIEANQEGFAEATRRGLIPEHASPTFVKRYKLLEGERIGRQLHSGWSAEYDSWAGKGGDDPAAVDRHYADYIKRNIGTDDPDIIAGASGMVRQGAMQAADTDTQYRSRQFKAAAIRAQGAAINATVDDADEAGLASGKGTDYAATADAIERQRQAYIASGGTASDFDENGMKLIADKAVELRDPKLLDFFKRTVPGEEYTYGDTPTGSALKQDATVKLETIARAQVVDAGKEEERQRKAQADAATRTAIDALVAGEAVPEDVLAAGSKADADFRVKVGEWKANLAKGRRDDRLVRQIKQDIMDGGGMGAVMAAASGIESPEDLDEVVNFAKSFEAARPTIDDIMGSASAKTIMGVLDSRTKTAGSFLDPIAGMTQEGLEAQYDFRRMVSLWSAEHPNASVMEREEAVAKIGKLLTDRLLPSSDDPKVQLYNRDAAAVGGFENPYSPAPGQPGQHMGLGAFDKLDGAGQAAALQEARRQGLGVAEMMQRMDAGETFAAPPTPQPSAAPNADRGGDVLSMDAQRYLDTFSPAEQAKIRKGAEGRAGGLSSMLDHLQRSGMKPKAPHATAPSGAAALDGTPIAPIAYRPSSTSYAPDEPDEGGPDERPRFTQAMAESFLAAVIADPDGKASGRTITATATTASGEADPQTAHLLDLIGEEEAKGNYNAVFGNAGSKRDLSAFTLDDILGQQQAARRRGVRSTAIGRYQFIFKTLRGLKEEMGLSGSEAFTPELQDRMAVRLLERRGYAAFREGRLSQRQFALRLSQEWASMPDPRTGRSYYAGDGLNASRLKTRDVYAALGFPMGGDA